MWTTILDDERKSGWANTAGSAADIVVPIRQAIIDRLLSLVAWPRVVEQLYLRLAGENRLELMVVASMFGFRKRFDMGLRLDPVPDGQKRPRVTLTIENPGLMTTALALAQSALPLPRGVIVESGRIILDLDSLAGRPATRISSRTCRESDVPSAMASSGSPRRSRSRPGRAARPFPRRLPLRPGLSTAPAASFDASEVLPLFAGARATFSLRLAEAFVNQLVGQGLTSWRAQANALTLVLPRDLDAIVEALTFHFDKGWLTVKGSVALAGQEPSSRMLSDDPAFEQKAADIIGLYLNLPQHAAVFAVDEKTAIQALDRLDPVLPLAPGRAERHGFEYYRHGTLSLYAALNTKTGEIIGQTVPRHTSEAFVDFLDRCAHDATATA